MPRPALQIRHRSPDDAEPGPAARARTTHTHPRRRRSPAATPTHRDSAPPLREAESTHPTPRRAPARRRSTPPAAAPRARRSGVWRTNPRPARLIRHTPPHARRRGAPGAPSALGAPRPRARHGAWQLCRAARCTAASDLADHTEPGPPPASARLTHILRAAARRRPCQPSATAHQRLRWRALRAAGSWRPRDPTGSMTVRAGRCGRAAGVGVCGGVSNRLDRAAHPTHPTAMGGIGARPVRYPHSARPDHAPSRRVAPMPRPVLQIRQRISLHETWNSWPARRFLRRCSS